MTVDYEHFERRFHDAIASFWNARDRQKQKQIEGGKIDAGTRGAVTGGTQMGALEVLVSDVLQQAGLQDCDIKTRTALELPGYYRPEKKWDLIVVSAGQLVAVMEFKSQAGPSFGNNFNNRCEEAIGSASDIWIAFRERRFGTAPAPFLGYFFLLHDCPQVRKPLGNKEPYFAVDPVFKGTTYAQRYEHLCRRLVAERLYTAACLTLATDECPPAITEPAADLSFHRFVAGLVGHATAYKNS